MTQNETPARVVAIMDPGPTQEQIKVALLAKNDFQLVDVFTDIDRLGRELRADQPEILLVDHVVAGQHTLDMIDDLAVQFPESAVVAILPEDNPLSAQQAMLAGARAFIVQPFTQVNLLSTLRRVRELEARRLLARPESAAATAVEARPLRTLVIYSPRGGVGCSTVAVNLAVSLHEATGGRVLLVDGKLSFGHLDLMLNIRSHNSIADLVPHSSALDETLIADVVNRHVSGVQVLLSPSDVQIAQGIRPQDLFNVISALQRYYDFLIIDAGSALNENTVTLMDAADRVMLVFDPDLAALHDTGRFIQISRSLAYPPDKLLFVLNRAGLPGGVRSKDIELTLRHGLFAQIPDDGPNALRSLNRGIPLVLKYGRSPASKGVKALAKALIEQNVTHQAASVEGTAQKVKGSPRLAITQSS